MLNSKKSVLFLLLIIFLTLTSFKLSPYFRQLMYITGLLQDKILIAGTGSMYPTFPKSSEKSEVLQAKDVVAWPKMRVYSPGINILGKSLFSYELKHGDIVEFENEKTKAISAEKYQEEAGFVKRIIGLPGEFLELKDGFVLLNGKLLDEPYTARPRSTFGGEYLPECKSITIPGGFVFVLGDNRKASLDSRFSLGLVETKSIHYVLPWDLQSEYKSLWRETKDDILLAKTPTLDTTQFVKLLNEKRKEKKLPALKYNSLLSLSSKRRGFAMITADDFSKEASRSGVDLAKATKEVGYQNIIHAEVFTRGAYEAEELLDNFLEFPQTKNILFSSQYQDIGLSDVIGEINNCPMQVVVVHLGGYIAPNYKKEDLENWQNLINNLESIMPSWQALKQADNIDKGKLEELLSLLETRLNNARKILTRLKANQWLNQQEKDMVANDKSLSQEAEKIINELNNH